jgi:hypothetical protein
MSYVKLSFNKYVVSLQVAKISNGPEVGTRSAVHGVTSFLVSYRPPEISI